MNVKLVRYFESNEREPYFLRTRRKMKLPFMRHAEERKEQFVRPGAIALAYCLLNAVESVGFPIECFCRGLMHNRIVGIRGFSVNRTTCVGISLHDRDAESASRNYRRADP